MAFSNTFVTLDDVSTSDLATVPGQVVVVSGDGTSIRTVANTSIQGDAFRTFRNLQDNKLIIADQSQDVVTFASGTGMDIQFNEGTDTITFNVDSVTGYTGSQGDTGFTGSKGERGEKGFTGSQGDLGYTGSQGDLGYTGSMGDQGNAAPQADAFRTFRNQADSKNIIADQVDDTVTFAAGSGLEIDFNEALDTITWSITGVTGYTGSQGDTGFTGSQGYGGSAGPNGFTGSQGNRGYTGSTGAQGAQGFSGSAGIQGFNGSRGWTGSVGFNGSVGFVGSAGFNGSRGFTGNTGATGFTGSQGIQGNVGFTGSRGNVGITGYTGSRGITGFNGSRGLTGFVGSQGNPGYGGSQGVIGFTGSKGDTGDPGYIGSSGFQGSAGFQGSQGFVGSRGLQGYTGSRGFSGSRGEVGLLGPQGPKGFTGSQGLRGYTGSAQPAWRTFRVIDGARQENVIADQEQDVLDFVAGPGVTLTADADLDSIVISAASVSEILADISVVENTPIGAFSTLEYNNAGLFTFTSASPDDIVASANIDLSNYYTKSETYSQSQVDALIANVDANVDLTNYYTKPETNVLLDAKMGSFAVTNGTTLFTVTDAETVNLLGTPGQIENTMDVGLQQIQWSLADELSLNNVIVNGSLFSNDLTADAITVDGDTTITGNLLVLGNTTTINSNVISSGDTIIVLNADLPSTVPPTQNLGLEGNRGNQANVFLIWDEAADQWTVQDQTFVAGNFVGNIDLSGNSIVDLNDVSVDNLDDGEILVWDSANAQWTNTTVDFTEFVGVVNGLETNVAILQGNVVAIELELANISDTDAQTLNWNTNNADLSISNGNTVDLSTLYQSLSLNTTSNVLTISEGNSVDFTPILGGGGSGGGTATVERFRVNYNAGGDITSVNELTSGISSVTIIDAVAGEIQITLDNNVYTLPPGQITYFGYDIPNDRYAMQALTDVRSPRFIAGDSGNAFGGSSTIVIDLLADRSATSADGGFGGSTHAYIQMTCTTV